MKRGLTKRADVQVMAKTETAAARRAEELIDLITRRASTISEAFYDIGAALGEILLTCDAIRRSIEWIVRIEAKPK